MPKLSVLLPTKDRKPVLDQTLRNLREILDNVGFETEVIITNNSDRPVEMPFDDPRFKVFDNPRNKNSVFSSRNYGASLATGDILLFLDDDVLMGKEAIEHTVVFHKTHEKACFNVNWIYPPSLIEKIIKTQFGRFLVHFGFHSEKIVAGNPDWRDDVEFETKSAASGFFCIQKKHFEEMGGYNENLAHEGDDIDLSESLVKHGIKIWLEPRIMNYHNEEDRTSMVSWLKRQMRMGIAAKQATNRGNLNARRYYSPLKKRFFLMLYALQNIVYWKMKLIPNHTFFDPLYFKIVNLLLGAHICKGYHS